MMTIDQAIENYSKMNNYKERREFSDAYARELMKNTPIEKLAKEWFKDYGDANEWGYDTQFKYGVAHAIALAFCSS